MTTVGSIGDLQPGAHACMTFTEEEHLKMVLELAGAQEASQLRVQVSHGQP